jgi:hypothetical protein
MRYIPIFLCGKDVIIEGDGGTVWGRDIAPFIEGDGGIDTGSII